MLTSPDLRRRVCSLWKIAYSGWLSQSRPSITDWKPQETAAQQDSGAEMTREEAQAWLAETRRSRNHWIVDSIHCSPTDTLIFKGGEKGQFVQIRALKSGGHGIEIGTYEDAFPHIGEAAFSIKGRKKVEDWGAALKWLVSHMPELQPLVNRLMNHVYRREDAIRDSHEDFIDRESDWERRNIR